MAAMANGGAAGAWPAAGTVAEASAPGRLDALGGVIDYSGGTALEWPLSERTMVRAEVRGDRILSVTSGERRAEADLDALAAASLAGLKDILPHASRWALYVLGCVKALHEARGWLPGSGLGFTVTGTVPESKGVSSSAALETATMAALLRLGAPALDGMEFPLLCQKVENIAVGAPCGILDQISCAWGRAGHLLPVLCQPAGFGDPIALPPSLGLMGVDSDHKHSVAGPAYGRARAAAFLAKAWIETHWPDQFPGGLDYLANVDADRYARAIKTRLPDTLTGAEAGAMGLRLSDPLSRLEADHAYPLRAAADYAIEGQRDVLAFIAYLRQEAAEPDRDRREALGRILLRAHAGYGPLGVGAAAADRLLEAGMGVPGMLGGRITGGGSGGTVAFLYDSRAFDAGAMEGAIRAYQAATGARCWVFRGSSEGACRAAARLSNT